MTLLIVFLSLTNMALGYGLAVYLGHAQPFWQTPMRPVRPAAGSPPRQQPASRSTDRAAPVEQSPPVEQKTISPKPATPPVPSVAETPAEEEPRPSPAAELPPAENVAVPTAEETPAREEASEELSLQDTLKDLEAFREQVHEQQNPPTIEENLAEESAGGPEDNGEDASEQTEVSGSEMGEEDLLKGIGAFQEQLKKQQELSKIPGQ